MSWPDVAAFWVYHWAFGLGFGFLIYGLVVVFRFSEIWRLIKAAM